MDDIEKQQGTSPKQQYSIMICEFKLELQSGNG